MRNNEEADSKSALKKTTVAANIKNLPVSQRKN